MGCLQTFSMKQKFHTLYAIFLSFSTIVHCRVQFLFFIQFISLRLLRHIKTLEQAFSWFYLELTCTRMEITPYDKLSQSQNIHLRIVDFECFFLFLEATDILRILIDSILKKAEQQAQWDDIQMICFEAYLVRGQSIFDQQCV